MYLKVPAHRRHGRQTEKRFQEFPEAQGRVCLEQKQAVFQTRGPAMLNEDRSPIVVRDLGTSSRAALAVAERMPVRR